MVKKNSYSDLKHKFQDYIIIQKAGCFYDIREFGAVFLSKHLGVTLYSDKTSQYKVGIPVKSVERALNIIKEANYKYIITENYEIIEQNNNGKPAVLNNLDTETLKYKINDDKDINPNNTDRKQLYLKYISQIRNYILEQNKWIEIIEIEKFFGLKRRGKLIEGDNLSTIAHIINRFLKKEGFKTKRVNLEDDYSIWVAPSHIGDFVPDNIQYGQSPKYDDFEIENTTNFYSILKEEDAQEILTLNNCEEYDYNEKLLYLKDKFGALGHEHTNFQCIGRFGKLNQYILESFCVLNKFSTRQWVSSNKISKNQLIENATPIKFRLIKENGHGIDYELFNLSQTLAYQELENEVATSKNETKLTKKDLADTIVEFISNFDGIYNQVAIVKTLIGEKETNSAYEQVKNTKFFGIYEKKYANILSSLISILVKLNKIQIDYKFKVHIMKKETVKSNENLEDYNKIVKLINSGKNIFVTGSAGTGKSFILNKLKEKYKKRLELTSTTGISAVNIKGITIHSWAGVGICKKTLDKCVRDILDKQALVNKIRKCKLLAIDEISMLKGETFTYIDHVLRMVRGNNLPFGGIQILLFGDFFQLPPVEVAENDKSFCFETISWQELNLVTVKLEKIHRQSEVSFIKALNDIRENKIEEDDFKLLKSREIDYDTTESSMLHIFSRNEETNNYNKQKFDAIDSQVYTYKANIGIYRNEKYIEEGLTDRELMILDVFQKNCKVLTELCLKKGCRVMLMINLDFEKGLINGSCGEIIALDDTSITVKFDNGIVEDVKLHKFEYYYNDILTASMRQFPLRLAYAITIHKSQGMTLENVVVDCNKIFEEGQTYVALSRVKNLNGLFLKGFSLDKIKVNSKVVEFYKNLT